MFEAQIAEWFTFYAYQPLWVYTLIVLLMFASSFGLPLPEEVTLISAGLAGFMALHPDKYPPPEPGLEGVNPYILATVCVTAVFLSDYLIYWLGWYISNHLNKYPKWKERMQSKPFQRVQKWIHNYGTLAPCIFRFTPGLRFPGHMMCGAIGLPRWKFIAVDGTAALLTVPTQILLVSFYGEVILKYLSRMKFVVGGVAIAAFIIYYFYRRSQKQKDQSTKAS